MNGILGSMRRIDERAARCAWRMSTTPTSPISGQPDRAGTARALDRHGRGRPDIGRHRAGPLHELWEGAGRIDVCDPPKHLVMTMEPGTDDEAVIEAVLTEDGTRARLVIEERGLPLDVLYKHGAGLAGTHRGSRSLPGRRRIELEGALDGTHAGVQSAGGLIETAQGSEALPARSRNPCG